MQLSKVDCRILKLTKLNLQLVLLLLLLKKKAVLRRWWVKPHLQPHIRDQFGSFQHVFEYFRLHDHEEFYKYTRMSVRHFNILDNLLKSTLTKTSNRKALSPTLKLAVTVVYLANGGNPKNEAKNQHIGDSTIYPLLKEVCDAIWRVLKPLYLPKPNRAKWLEIASVYEQKWNFPNCVGALDGKHFAVRRPPHMGGKLHNYKKFPSIVLLATCDAYKRVTWFSLGDYGSFSDSSIFNNSKLYKKMSSGQLDLPPARNLPNSNKTLPYVFVGDEIFPLLVNLSKPFPRRLRLNRLQQIFNYRLSRARWTIECTFGILLARWLLLQQSLRFGMQMNRSLISAAICLHNFIITEELKENIEEYVNIDNYQNVLNLQNEVVVNVRDRNIAVSNRLLFAEYFANEGSVPWQEDRIRYL